MVSLADSSRRQGGFNSELSINNSHSTEDVYGPVLGFEDEPRFRKIPSTPIIACQMLLLVGTLLIVWLLPHCYGDHVATVPTDSILIYLHMALWLIILLTDRVLWKLHHDLRTNGYLEFYRKTRNIRRVPLVIYSCGAALLPTLMVLLADYEVKLYKALHCSHGYHLCRLQVFEVLLTIEVVVTLPLLVVFLVWTVNFNRKGEFPDGQQDDLIQALLTGATRRAHTSEVGFKDDKYTDELMERQSDLIRYLREHNSHLARKVLSLNAQLLEQQANA